MLEIVNHRILDRAFLDVRRHRAAGAGAEQRPEQGGRDSVED
jgi:hypothetical protein